MSHSLILSQSFLIRDPVTKISISLSQHLVAGTIKALVVPSQCLSFIVALDDTCHCELQVESIEAHYLECTLLTSMDTLGSKLIKFDLKWTLSGSVKQTMQVHSHHKVEDQW